MLRKKKLTTESKESSILHSKNYFINGRKKKQCCRKPNVVRDFDALLVNST